MATVPDGGELVPLEKRLAGLNGERRVREREYRDRGVSTATAV